MNGVCKVQQLKASLLTDEERGAIARLKKDEGRDNEAEVEAENNNTAAQADEKPRTRGKKSHKKQSKQLIQNASDYLL